jgi:hypothetical protein
LKSRRCARSAEPREQRRNTRRDVGGAGRDQLRSRSIPPLDADHPYTARLRRQDIVHAITNHHGVVSRDLRVLQCRSQAFGFVTPLIARTGAMDGFEVVIDRKVREDALGDGGWLRGDHRKPVAARAQFAKCIRDVRKELIADEADVLEALTIRDNRAIKVIVIGVGEEPLKDDA